MQSKTSYFNPTLFKKNLMRFWPLWGGASAVGALIPLYLLTTLIRVGFQNCQFQPLEMTIAYYEALHYAVPIISLLYAVLCALAVWNYLYNHRSVSLYHALPITRKGLFVTNFLSGMAMMLIPYAVTGGLMILISIPVGAFEPVGVLAAILGVLGYSFFYFSAATLIAFVTGNPFAYAAFYFIFHFLAAAAEWIVSELMSEFYFGVSYFYEGVLNFLSPTIFFLDYLTVNVQYHEITTPDGWIDYGRIESVALTGGWIIAVYALAGLALLGCAWALYQRRRSESAGDVVAVGWMKPVFRYGVSLCAAVIGGAILYRIFCTGFQQSSTAAPVPMAVCMAIAGLVGYYIASMLLAKSLRVFRGSGKGALASVIAAAAVCAVIALDPAGMESWVPEAGDLESVTIELYCGYGNGVHTNVTDPAAIQKILSLHSAILAEEAQLDRDESCYAQVGLRYYDQEGHLGERRSYFLHYPAGLQSEALRQMKELACDPAVQEANIFGNITENTTRLRLTSGYVGELYDAGDGEIKGLDLTQEQAKQLEEAIRRDIQAGHFGRTFLSDSYEDYQSNVYYSELHLYYNATRTSTVGYNGSTYNDSVSVTISTYCTETLNALKDMGVLDETHRLLTAQEYRAMTKNEPEWYGPYDAADLGGYDGSEWGGPSDMVDLAGGYGESVYAEGAF